MNKIKLTLSGLIVPKARPRVTRGSTFMPANYVQWKDAAVFSFTTQTSKRELTNVFITVVLRGKHRESADSDNLIGSIFDALVKAKIIVNDNLKHVRGHSLVYRPSKEPPTVEIIIRKSRNQVEITIGRLKNERIHT